MKKLLSCFLGFALMLGSVCGDCSASAGEPPREFVGGDMTPDGKRLDGADLWTRALGHIKQALFNVQDSWLVNYPIFKSWFVNNYFLAKDWTYEHYAAFKSWLNSTYTDTKDWTLEKFDEANIWFDQLDPRMKVGAIAGAAGVIMAISWTIRSIMLRSGFKNFYRH